MNHTRLLRIGELDRGEFWIRVLLFFHGDERFEAKALKTLINEYMANTVQRSVDKFDVRGSIESPGSQKATPAPCVRQSYCFILLVLAEMGYMIKVGLDHFTSTIDAQRVLKYRIRVPPLRV